MTRSLLLSSALSLVLGSPVLSQDQAQTAQETLKRIGVQRGLAVLVGGAADDRVLDLVRSSELTWFVQLSDRASAARLRRAADEAGLLGRRVYVDSATARRIHLADNLADAIVVVPGAAELSKEELLRVLRPGGKVLRGNDTLVKPALEGTDEWTHPYHGPDNNPQSKDRLARKPYLTHFMAEPWYAAMPQMTVIGGGRIFKAFGNRTSAQPQWTVINTLLAMSAYNGTILWKRPLPEHFMLHRNTLIASKDTVYLADDTSCKLIDAATGKVRDEIVAPDDAGGKVWKWMALQDGVLYALIGEGEANVRTIKGNRFRGAGWPWWRIKPYSFGFGRTILAIDPASKKVLWRHREEHPIDGRALCMNSERIFIYSDRKFLGAIDRKTGKTQWKSSDAELLAAIGEHDAAQHWMKGFASTAYAKCSEKGVFFAGPTRTRIVGVAADTGKLLWQHKGGNSQLIVREDGLYALGEARRNEATSSLKIDPLSGEILARFPGRDRCTRATGSVDAIFTRGGRGGSTAVFDVTSAEPKMGVVSPMRPACQDGVVVANGLLYWGPWMCRCDDTQIGVIALGGGGSFDYEAEARDADRLEATLTEVKAMAAAEFDWPTYRRDNSRSTRSPFDAPERVEIAWTYDPPGSTMPAAPIAVGITTYVSGSDGTIRAVDSRNGNLLWSAHTGGGMKISPTYWNGRLYAGSGDGWIYCLDAATGKRLWRFRAAPVERRIPVYGSLLSTWPVGTGVLVEDGVAYAAAGMANYDGTHVYALDAVTGKIRWKNHGSGHRYEGSRDSGAGVQGPFLLHRGGLYMPAGNLVSLARYAVKDGSFSRAGGGRGKDLYVLNGNVRASGYPLYWREEDLHYIGFLGFPLKKEGYLAVTENRVGHAEPKPDKKGRPKYVWSQQPFQENSAAVLALDAVIVSGVHRTGAGKDVKTTAGICALSLEDGRTIWKEDLPSPSVGFGIAVDRAGRILVSLQDGRLVCLKEK